MSSTITARTGDVRVLTINLAGRHGDWETRRKILIAGVKALNPDLVAFQEVVKDETYDQAVDLLGNHYHIVHQEMRKPAEEGIAIASRWPIGEVKELDLRETPRSAIFCAGALIAEIQTPAHIGPLLFVNHFPNWQLNFEYERELQTLKTARFTEQAYLEKNKPQVILVGDLDASPEASSIRFLSGRQSLDKMSVCYRDAWDSVHHAAPGHTYSLDNSFMKDQIIQGTQPFRDWPFTRIDYIFVRFGEHGGFAFDIKGCERVFDQPVNGFWASDHYGLVADLAVRKKSA